MNTIHGDDVTDDWTARKGIFQYARLVAWYKRKQGTTPNEYQGLCVGRFDYFYLFQMPDGTLLCTQLQQIIQGTFHAWPIVDIGISDDGNNQNLFDRRNVAG